MKKYVAFLLCLMMILSLFSCNIKNANTPESSDNMTAGTTTQMPPNNHTEDSTDSVPTESATESPSNTESVQNELAWQAYGMAIRNEIKIYYPLLSSPPKEIYLKNVCGMEKSNPTRQALVDMDKDGINELILDYKSFFILLHFENGFVYATDFHLKSMETIYTDGSFSWSHHDDVFGYEYGISRVSFVNGIKKVEELCRIEGDSNFFINGVPVTIEQYSDYIAHANRTPIRFTPFAIPLLNSNELRAIELASAHWGIQNGDFDSERGFRYRIVYSGTIGNLYRVSLYRFVYNSYYEHLEIASVNIDTEKISIEKYPDGKG